MEQTDKPNDEPFDLAKSLAAAHARKDAMERVVRGLEALAPLNKREYEALALLQAELRHMEAVLD